MQATVKTLKRRVIQKAAESLGKAEHVAADEDDFKQAVQDFKQLELDLEKVLQDIKAMRSATARMTERNVRLAETMAAYFASETENADPAASMHQASRELLRSAERAHVVVQRSAGKVLETKATAHLQSLVADRFPGIKERISKHKGLETDLSSYVRKVKGLESRPAGDAEKVKFTEKRDRTQAEYDALHRELLTELRQLHNERHSLMRGAFVALLASQAEMEQLLSEGINAVLTTIDRGEAQLTRDNIRTLVSSGGPPEGSVPTDSEGTPRSGAAALASGLMKTLRGKTSDDPKRASLSPSTKTTLTTSSSPVSRLASPPSAFASTPPAASISSVPVARIVNEPKDVAPTAHNPFAPASTSAEPEPSSSNGHHLAPDGGVEEEEEGLFERVRAIHDYHGEDEGDLSFNEGEVFYLEQKPDVSWWVGFKETGERGQFPANYVELVPVE